MPDTYAESTDGLLLVANGIDPVRRWNGYAASFYPAGLAAPEVAPIAVVSGDGPIRGRYVVYVAWVDADGNESSLSVASGEVVASQGSRVTVSHAETPPQRATGYRFYRTTDAQRRVAYLDFEGVGRPPVQTYVSTNTDADLQASVARALLSDRNEFLPGFDDPPPDTCPVVCWHGGRMYLAGIEPFAEGSCQVATGSATVTGVGTRWRANWAGRFLHVPNTPPAEIESVDEDAQTITLVDPWTGPSDPFSAYSVRPAPATENTFAYSEAGKPESWSPQHALALPEDGDTPTAVYNLNSFLFFAKRRVTHRLSVQTDPGTDGSVFRALDRGAVNQRCVVPVDGAALVLDDRGVYSYTGGGTAQTVSEQIQNLFRESSGINWQAQKWFHGVNCPTEDTCRFFVALRGDHLPRHALCFNYRLGRWWVEAYPFPVGAAVLGWSGRVTGSTRRGTERVYLAGPGGRLYALGGLSTDGTASGGGEPLAVASASPCRVTLAGTPVYDDGIVGAGIAVCDGRGAGQVRMVVAASGPRVEVDRPWRVKPDDTSKVILGGIGYRLTTGRYRWANAEKDADRGVEVWFEPRPGHVLAVSTEADLRGTDLFPLAQAERDANGVRTDAGADGRVVDLGKPQGFAILRQNAHREGATDGDRTVSITLAGASGAQPHVLSGLVVRGANS